MDRSGFRRFVIGTSCSLSACFLAFALRAEEKGGSVVTFRGGESLLGQSSSPFPEQPVLLWHAETNGTAVAPPVIHNGVVFVGADDGSMQAFLLADGSLRWRRMLGAAVGAPVLAVGDRLYVGDESGVFYSLKMEDGSSLWKFKAEDRIAGSANAVCPAEGKIGIVVGSYDMNVYCLDADTGNKIWSYETANYINGAIAVSAEGVIFGGCDGLLHVLDPRTGKEIKSVDAGGYVAGSPVIAAGKAYVGNYEGQIRCVDLMTGTILWQFGEERTGPFFAPPAYTDRMILAGNRNGNIYALSPTDGSVLWKLKTQGEVDSGAVTDGRALVVGSEDGLLYIASLLTGKVLWSYDIGAAVETSPFVSERRIVVTASDGNVYAFGDRH